MRRSTIFCCMLSLFALGAARESGTPMPATPAPCVSREELGKWPVERRVAQLVMVGINIDSPRRAANIVRTYGLGGILVRGTPAANAKTLLATIAAAGGDVAPFLAVDEEGGRVQHLRRAIGAIPSARTMATTMTPTQVEALATKHGKSMRSLGFTMNFGPVLDLLGPASNGIGDRSFSANPDKAMQYGLAYARGLSNSGVVPVFKHFPGHGRASGDSHNIGPVTPSIDDLRGLDMRPFAGALAALAPNPRLGVMVAHVEIPGLEQRPASISRSVVEGLLRKELGFQGLVVTDSLSMRPIRYHFPAPQAAVEALRAGSDLLVFDDEPDVGAIVAGLVDAVRADPTLAARVDLSLRRMLTAKGIADCPTPSASSTVPTPTPPTPPPPSTATPSPSSPSSTTVAPAPSSQNSTTTSPAPTSAATTSP